MKIYSKAIILVAALALSACSGAGRFGPGGPGGAGGPSGADGSASDPASPAYFQQTIGDRVLFPVDQATLTAEGRDILTLQAKWLMTNGDYSAIIEGHADEQGTRAYNLALGARRSNAVHEYLISQGVSPARLKTVTFGKERPISICSVESCYSQNRRAVTVVAAGGTS